MRISSQQFNVRGISYIIRSAEISDAEQLSKARLQIDGETENLDREQGEAFLDTADFERIIHTDAERLTNLFLVAVVDGRVAGFSRCEGSTLKRRAHQAEFGICVLKEFWGYGIGKNLLITTLSWADDAAGISKVSLHVLETNVTALQLYKSLGFEEEGLLKKDKLLSDGKYYNTVIMGRFHG